MWRAWVDGAGIWGKEARKGRFGETEKQKDVWPQTQAAKGERKCKGEDQRTKNWGLKSLKEGRDWERGEMEVYSGEKEDEKWRAGIRKKVMNFIFEEKVLLEIDS